MRGLRENITRWVVTETDTGFTFAAPTAIKGRWESVQESFKGVNGEDLISNAIVGVNVAVNVGDYLFQGTSKIADPTALTGTYRVRKFTSMKNLRGAINERVAYL